jgi:transcriptional regulator with XRE-family HTH domain
MEKSKGRKTHKGMAKREGDLVQTAGGEDFLTDSSPRSGFGIPSSEKETLGDRVRRAREERGLTLQDLSSRTGISAETIERVEANKMIPPLGELIKLGKAVEMKMGYFISPGTEKPITVVRAHSRPMISRHGQAHREQYGYFYESLAPAKANRLMEPFLVTLIPSSGESFSQHDGQEFIFVLEGEVATRVGEQKEILGPGDAVYYDSSFPHLVKCSGAKPAKILAVLYAGPR